MIEQKLSTIGLKEDETKAFLFLLKYPNQSVGIIARKTGISRTSLYGYIKNLKEKGLVIQSQKSGVKTFSIAPKETIAISFDERLKEINQAKMAIQEAFNEVQKGTKPSSSPRLQIFEGKKEMQHLIRDVLLYQNIKSQSYWPIKKMLEVLGENLFKEFNKERIKRNIHIDAIWPQKQIIDIEKYPYMSGGKSFLREIRIAPKEIDFSMGYWIYENKVSFVSSQKSNFGFIIENKEFADMLASQFKIIWDLSKKIPVSDTDSQRFFVKMMEN